MEQEKLPLKTKLRRWYKNLKTTYQTYGLLGTLRRENTLARKIDDLIWWTKYRTTHKYNNIKIKTLKPGYYDTDTRILHGVMQLLTDYVDNEKPFEKINWDTDDQTKQVKQTIQEVYHWWKNIYPKYEENNPMEEWYKKYPLKDFTSTVYQVDKDGDPTLYELKIDDDLTPEQKQQKSQLLKQSFEYEKQCHDETTQMLTKVINIRLYLWT